MLRRRLLDVCATATLALGPTGCLAPATMTSIEVPELVSEVVGEDRGAGNVVGLQAWMTPDAYRSEERFAASLGSLFAAADDEGWLQSDTVVVLPEMIGTWLVAADEDEAVYAASTTTDAMLPVIAAHLGAWLSARDGAPADDVDTYAVFAVKAEAMAVVYQRVIGALAASYRVTVVGGSILLPEPSVKDGAIVTAPGGPLRNASFVFGPDGEILGPPTIKAFPTSDEQGFVAAGHPADLPVFETPAGRLAVLICADAWYPEPYQALEGRSVDVVVVPVFIAGDAAWEAPWGGYDGHATPPDVDLADKGRLTEADAWRRYSLPGRAPSAAIETGLTVPLRGALWDLGADGQALAVRAGSPDEAPEHDAPTVINLWR